jgi:hypothetical protein
MFEPVTKEDVMRYKNQDHTRLDPAEIEANVAAYNQYLEAKIEREGPYKADYW